MSLEGAASEEITLRQAGTVLGVSNRRVLAMVHAGALKGTLKETPAGAYMVVQRSDVERLAQERRAVAEGVQKKSKPGPKPRVPASPTGGS